MRCRAKRYLAGAVAAGSAARSPRRASRLNIETVTEIFIRVNSAGVPLSQADFAMSKIAVNETHGGNTLRKVIDSFGHLAVTPGFYDTMRNDAAFVGTDFFHQMGWMRHEQEDLYDPNYTDMPRVAFALTGCPAADMAMPSCERNSSIV